MFSKKFVIPFSLITATGLFTLYSTSKAYAAPVLTKLSKDFQEFTISRNEQVTHDTHHLYIPMKLDDNKLPVSSFILCKDKNVTSDDGKAIIRPYTPLENTLNDKNELQLVVKSYGTQGNMSTALCNKKAGDTIEIKGPLKKLSYTANKHKHITFFAGGTGLTPCLQIINEIVNNPDDHTTMTMFFANKTDQDILCKAHLDQLSKKHKALKIHYIVDKIDTTNTINPYDGTATTVNKDDYLIGRINESMVENLMPRGRDNYTFAYVCGPPGFYQTVSGKKDFKDKDNMYQGKLSGFLPNLNYTSDMVFKL